MDGVDQGVSACTFGGGLLRDQEVTCSVQADDGTDQSLFQTRGVVIIENGAPTVSQVTVLPSAATSSDTLTCDYAVDDPDGDTVSSCVTTWTVNGAAYTGLLSDLARGTQVQCAVSCTDPRGASSPSVQSSTVIIGNSAPVVSNVAVSPDPFEVGDALTCNYDYTDADGDRDLSQIQWTVNGSAAGHTEMRLASEFACAKRWDGTYSCWGSDAQNGFSVPGGLEEWELGYQFGCGLDAAGQLSCWGGMSTWDYQPDPALTYSHIEASTDVTYACALTDTGSIECFGGPSCLANCRVMSEIPTDDGFTDLAVTDNVACALDSDGYPECWGKFNDEVLTEAPASTAFDSIAGGSSDVCGVVKSTGAIKCWGQSVSQFTPPSNGPFIDVRVSMNHGCAIRAADRLPACWGTEGCSTQARPHRPMCPCSPSRQGTGLALGWGSMGKSMAGAFPRRIQWESGF